MRRVRSFKPAVFKPAILISSLKLLISATLLVIFLATLSTGAWAQGQLTFEDVMKFEELHNPVISGNGEWIAFDVWPERGDGEARIKHPESETVYIIERGRSPILSTDGNWTAVRVEPPFIEAENAGSDRPDPSLSLLNNDSGEKLIYENVRSYEFSNDGRWLLVGHTLPDEVREYRRENSYIGLPVTLVDLDSGEERGYDFVNTSAIDSTSSYLLFGVVDTTGAENGLYAVELEESLVPGRVMGGENSYFDNLAWDHERGRIAFTRAELDPERDFRPSDAQIYSWQVFLEDPQRLVSPENIGDAFRLRPDNHLTWSNDGERLFYGVKLKEMVRLDEMERERDTLSQENLYDLDYILDGVESDVWHPDDPLIKPNEKRTWSSRKNHLYRAVYHLDSGRSVQLADTEMPNLSFTNNPEIALGRSQLPYRKLRTWDGVYHDYYLVDLTNGERSRLLEKSRFPAQLSPNGSFVAWFDGKDWHLADTGSGSEINLTGTLDIPFYNEDNDRPMPSPPYGIAGWTEGDRSVLIYDKYDIWQFDTRSGEVTAITDGAGREEERIFRIIDLDPDSERFASGEELLLSMYHDREKNFGYYRAAIGNPGVTRLLEEDVRYNFLAQADQAETILFTVERYDKFPNLWLSESSDFERIKKVTALHDDLTDRFAWGHAELIDWYNADGKKVQGVLIYPGGYEEGERYPVMIYYYERFSQRLHQFDHIYTNHRPVLAQYASDGYAVFLPDIWFDIPIPGYSATKNLVPGVQKLIEMGVADPEAIGLHGHSWSGYLTAQVVTQTDIFAAAVAGAPVSNMTSAYSGIRWGTGLARQFQYEQTQSRLGVSMWENLSPYIENSPVFWADRINTPLMLQFGDVDGAVPWEQGIELYLALRRLGKESVFLQYHDEPHHLQKYANRLDYAIKMKEYFDHYLKGTPAPEWITVGVPYRGE